MILIFDSIGGLSDQIKDLKTILYFIYKTKKPFSIRFASSRPISDPNAWNLYEFSNLFNEREMFSSIEYYVPYNSLVNAMNDENAYDFYNLHINGTLWKNDIEVHKKHTSKLYSMMRENVYNYLIVGGSMWYWLIDNLCLNYHNLFLDFGDVKIPIVPSDKIINCLNKFKQRISNVKYNYLHYRYESDWIPQIKSRNQNYIRPKLNHLINNLPYKTPLPIYIATSNIEKLYKTGLLEQNIDTYDNIIYKKNNDCEDLNYDESGFFDMLISIGAEEVFGFSWSGFSININKLKGSENYYDKLKVFDISSNYYDE